MLRRLELHWICAELFQIGGLPAGSWNVVADAPGPAEKASVVLRSDTGSMQPRGSVLSDKDGKFEFRGLEVGPIRAAAVIGKQTSEWVQTELREGVHAEIELHVARTRIVTGRITSAGNPVPGAAVVALVGEIGPFLASQQELSAADGTVGFEIPRQTQVFDVLAFDPSLCLTWQQVRAPPEGEKFEVQLSRFRRAIVLAVPSGLWTMCEKLDSFGTEPTHGGGALFSQRGPPTRRVELKQAPN